MLKCRENLEMGSLGLGIGYEFGCGYEFGYGVWGLGMMCIFIIDQIEFSNLYVRTLVNYMPDPLL